MAADSYWPLPRFLVAAAFVLCSGIVSSTAGAQNAAPLKVAIVGDSTVCDYPAGNPRSGWGTALKDFFPPNCQVVNRAIDGQSTKSFLKQGHWPEVLADKPDIILVGLGRNDARGAADPRTTNPNTDFQANLREFIRSAKAQQATVILVTPIHKRRFGRDGKLVADDVEGHVNVMKKVAKESGVPLVDLYTTSANLLSRMGEAASSEFASPPDDDLHYNAMGAGQWAILIARMLKTADPRLSGMGVH